MKFLQNVFYLFLVILLFSILAKDFKDLKQHESYNLEVNEAQKYINIKNDKFDEVKKLIETTIHETDSIMIYTNDTLINHINLFIKPNIKFENKPSSPLGNYEDLHDLYFPDPKKIKKNNQRVIDILDSFINYKDLFGFSVYHIDPIRNRNFKLTNKINDSSTYYTVAQFMYLSDKQKEKHIKRIEETSKKGLDKTKKKRIRDLNKEFHNKIVIAEIELQNKKIKNEFYEKMMPEFGIYKKSYYYFTCSNNSLSEKEFKQKIKLFEAMFDLKKKKNLKGKIIKVKVKNFEEIENTSIKLSKKKWMN